MKRLIAFLVVFLFLCSTTPFTAEVPEFLTRTSRIEPDLPYLRSIATNVMTAGTGVTGNGVTDDTTDISEAITLALLTSSNLWNGYHVVYFPAGTYVLNSLTKSGSACSNLYIIGDGDATIFKRVTTTSNIKVAEFTDCVHIRYSDLAVDHNGNFTFGGWAHYSVTDLIIERTHFYDSLCVGCRYDNATDLFGWLLPVGNTNSKDVIFRDNIIEDLQTELDRVEGLLVERNIFLRSPTTTAVGCFAPVATNNTCSDITIRDNLIVDYEQYGINILHDFSTAPTGVYKRIKIYNNKLRQLRSTGATGIKIGVSSNLWFFDPGDLVFEDIFVEGNEIYIDPAAAQIADSNGISFQMGANSNSSFNRVRISDNIIDAGTKLATFALRPDFIRTGTIEGNIIRQATFGITLGNPGAVRMAQNVVEARNVSANTNSIAYEYSCVPPTGVGNNIMVSNRYRGSPQIIFNLGTTCTGDSAATPTLANFRAGMIAKYVTFNPPALTNGQQATTTVSIPQIGFGSVIVGESFDKDLQGITLTSKVTAAGVVTFYFTNNTGGTVDLESGEAKVFISLF